ncbi:glycosyltransferase [Rufibacter roseus]|uniref:Glycosyltransferase n=1 Tax=Rufibacter roseus TaxID=1567108 RepID=A0ABW2DSC4_9BACT|nr:glycosyltransferase [Rufibacter roseus]
MAPKKILLLTVRADHGGGPKHLDILLNYLSESFSLFVACPKDKPFFQIWQTNPAVKAMIEVPHRKFTLSALFKLRQFIIDQEIEIVHSHGKGAGVYSRLLKATLPSLKVLHTFHGVHVQEYGVLSKAMYTFYEKLVKPLTNKFINVSEGEKNACLALGLLDQKRQVTVYNGIPAAPALKAPTSRLNQKFVIISISRFDYQKNMGLQYEIAKAMAPFQHVQFWWVGDGPEKEFLERKAKEENLNNITFLGFQNNPGQFLQEAQVYLSTSRWEGLPLALLEAASYGLPIVATNVTGNNEVVEHEVNGFLFNEDALTSVTDYLLQLESDSDLYKKMSLSSLEIFEQKFTTNTMIQKTEKVYLSL